MSGLFRRLFYLLLVLGWTIVLVLCVPLFVRTGLVQILPPNLLLVSTKLIYLSIGSLRENKSRVGKEDYMIVVGHRWCTLCSCFCGDALYLSFVCPGWRLFQNDWGRVSWPTSPELEFINYWTAYRVARLNYFIRPY